MRKSCGGMWVLAIVLLASTGCKTQTIITRPPLQEVYALPPQDDPRFSSPPQYPKDSLNQGNVKKRSNQPNLPPAGSLRSPSQGMGGMSGMAPSGRPY